MFFLLFDKPRGPSVIQDPLDYSQGLVNLTFMLVFMNPLLLYGCGECFR